MHLYDVLQRTPEGASIWLESGADLENAKTRLQELASVNPGERFFVFDQRKASVVPETPTQYQNSPVVLLAQIRLTSSLHE
jgi:hypothetical protein